MFEKLRHLMEDIHWEEAAELSWWWRFVHRQVRLFFYIVRELLRDRCLQQAASLSFTTLLALVPLFAVAFSFFRGFAATEGLEERAREAIFNAVFAAPLVQGMRRGEEEPRAPLPPALLKAMSAGDIAAEARKRAEARDYEQALRLYVIALNAGADAADFRQQVARLPLRQIAQADRTFQSMGAEARERYLEAAGLSSRLVPRWNQANPAAERALREAAGLEDSGRLSEALDAVRKAERMAYHAAKTREAAARIRHQMARKAAQEGPAAAVDDYRAALIAYTDAILLAGLYGPGEQLPADLAGHRQCRQGLADALFAQGRREAELYRELLSRSAQGQALQEALEAAIADLSEAAALAVDASRIHRELAELLWSAGRQDEARAQYEAALAVAGAGRISQSVVDRIRTFIEKVGSAGIGVLGSLFLLLTAISLLSTIESTLNHIWKVTEKRAFWIRFTSYCTLIWLGPALIGASIWARERMGYHISSIVGDMPLLSHAVGLLSAAGQVVLPFAMTWLVLVAIYRYLPHTRVRFGSAAWGAFLATVLLQLARPLFTLYVVHAVRYEKIYGSLGAIPIFLLWVWLLWLIVLFGAEVAFTLQNVGLLRYQDKLRKLSHVFIDRYLAARIMMYVAREFWESGGPISAGRLAEAMEVSVEEASDAARRLVRLGLLTPVGEARDEFHPARDLSKLRLSEVLSITDRFRDESRSNRPENRPYEDRLESVFRSAIAAQDEALNRMTFRDLLMECEQQRSKFPKGDADR